MELLYSNILPLRLSEGQKTIADCFNELLSKADSVEIAVGYVSYASLCELENLVENSDVSRICLNIGMYYIEGMPENSYHTAVKINEKWGKSGKSMGQIPIPTERKAIRLHPRLSAAAAIKYLRGKAGGAAQALTVRSGSAVNGTRLRESWVAPTAMWMRRHW